MASPSGLSASIVAYDFNSINPAGVSVPGQLDSSETATADLLCLNDLKLVD